jgi:FMN phosphatase YigB (HAD superfamily)
MLGEIELVTFDCFGTLLDWRQPLVLLGLDPVTDWPAFEAECRALQHPANVFLNYCDVLAEAAARIAPTTSSNQRALFARRFGEAPAFLDTSALPLIQEVVPIGVLSNCDAIHQLDATRSLGVAWDVAVLAEQIRAYKPHIAAWDAIVSRVREQMQVSPERWLHVSAFDDYDLAVARTFGVRTALLRRTGVGSNEADTDFDFAGLHDLLAALGDAVDGPITYEVRARPRDDDTARAWLSWMQQEHMDAVLATGLVRSARLEAERDHYRALYSLRRRRDLDRYLAEHAPRLRADGISRFGDRMAYERSVYRSIARRR